MISLTVMTGAVMSAIDTSIVNVALPYMRGNMGATVEEIAWVSTAYMLANVIIMPIVGLLSSRYGRANIYLWSIIVFTVSSFLCGIAWDLQSMIFFRVIQGIGGGCIIPISQAILRESFSAEKQGLAMGVFGLGVVMGPAFGPTIGGWLTDNYSWPWIFFINLPIGILNIYLITRYIKDPDYLVRKKERLDHWGLGLLIVGLGALQIMLEKGESKDWFASDYIRTLGITAAVGLTLFVWRELKAEKPAVDLRLLKNITFATGTMIGGVFGISLFASLFVLPIFLQQLLHYPALDSGLAMMPRSLTMAVTMLVSGRLYSVTGPKPLIGVGLIVSAFSFWQLSVLSMDTGYWDIFYPQVLQGIGFGMVFVSLSTVTLSAIEKSKMTDATGLYNVVRQVFGSVGIALSATFLSRYQNVYYQQLSEKITMVNDSLGTWVNTLTAGFFAKGYDAETAKMMGYKMINSLVTANGAMMAFNKVFFLVTVMFIISFPLIFLLKVKK